jgi:hypothetical protein
MKIRNLDIGVESITRWQAEDEIHLPRDRGLAPAFLPIHRPLDEILRRPSLDERLPSLMQPENLDPDLLQPAALTAARRQAWSRFAEAARRHAGRKRDLFHAASTFLESDIELDAAVYEALAALFRG